MNTYKIILSIILFLNFNLFSKEFSKSETDNRKIIYCIQSKDGFRLFDERGKEVEYNFNIEKSLNK